MSGSLEFSVELGANGIVMEASGDNNSRNNDVSRAGGKEHGDLNPRRTAIAELE